VQKRDIAIAGCGPGGLAAALFLHRAGHRVTLYERFAATQPVGSGLMIQPTGLAVLAALGLADALTSQAAPIHGLHGISVTSGRLALAMDFATLGPDQRAYGTHRALLFSILYDAVQREGIAIETGRTVTGTASSAGGGRALIFEDGRDSPRFDLVVDAMGARSSLSRQSADLPFGALWATLDWVDDPAILPDRLDQRYRRGREMAGIMPLGHSPASPKPAVAYFWSLKGKSLSAWQSSGLDAWRTEALDLWPESEPVVLQITMPEQFVFARYMHRTLRSPVDKGIVHKGIVHIGDAWHATSPQLGQGANMALLDAATLGWAMATASDIGNALTRYSKARSRHVRVYQRLSQVFTPAYQSDGMVFPWLRDQAISHLAHIWPVNRIIARIVSGQFVRPHPSAVLQTVSTRAQPR
jgi:2-polyprenyl-6-methoxyphenol hydroxylase-like FAD-dependent oxidoreductase